MAAIAKRETERGISYEVRVRKKGHPTQTKTFRTLKDAQKWARHVEVAVEQGVFVDRSEAENTTLHEALKRYLAEVTPHKKSARQEKSFIKAWMARLIAKRTLASLRGMDFAQHIEQRRKDGLADSSIRLELAVISHLYTVASKDWGMEGLQNPIRNIRMPRPARARDRRLANQDEMEAIIQASDSPFLPAILRLAVETGMRRSEILGLAWENIDLHERVALLPDTKNGDSREVPLSTRAVAVLKALPRRIDGHVFSINGAAASRAFIRARKRARATYEKECTAAGTKADPGYLMDLRFHDLRHEATSRLFEIGLDTSEVSSITGHKTLQMLKRYTHLRAKDLARKLG